MIIVEFLVFVISSGLFFSERFRGRIWAVVTAGAIATGSSVLFVYDMGARLWHHPPPPVQIVKQIVEKPVPVKTSQPASVGKPHSCADQYPADALAARAEGTTSLAFKILTDGTVDAVSVVSSSGSAVLDAAAVRCVAGWHYRPAIKDGQLAETAAKAAVKWSLPSLQQEPGKTAATPPGQPARVAQQQATQPATSETRHHWYDIGSWFSSDSDKKNP